MTAAADNAHPAWALEGQGRGELGAVDPRTTRDELRLRRRRPQPGLVRPRVPAPRARRGRAVLRRCALGCSAPPTCRRRPTTSSRRRAWPTPSPTMRQPPTSRPRRGARRRRSGDGRATARPPATRRRRRDRVGARRRTPGAAGSRPRASVSGRPASSPRRATRRSSSTSARRTGCAGRTCCTSSPPSACRGVSLVDGRGVERHVPRDVGAGMAARVVDPADRVRRRTAPRSSRRRPTGWSTGPATRRAPGRHRRRARSRAAGGTARCASTRSCTSSRPGRPTTPTSGS